MQRTGRLYRRRTRKAACSYCSSRHIRCRAPEEYLQGTSGRQLQRCKACHDANVTCELESLSSRKGNATRSPGNYYELHVAPDPQQQSQEQHPLPSLMPASSAMLRIQDICTDYLEPVSSSISECSSKSDTHHSNEESSTATGGHGREGSEMLFVRLIESSANRNNSKNTQSGNRIICFGETSSYTYTIQERCSPGSNQSTASPKSIHDTGTGIDNNLNNTTNESFPSVHSTHYSIPDEVDETAHDLPDSDMDVAAEEAALLRKMGALSLPPKAVQDALLAAYFRWLHPALQLFDQNEFMQRLSEGRVSLLLLQALFFVATIYVEDDIIRANYSSRQAAEIMFFKRAKALYEVEHESDSIAIIQALFLMSFWWKGPTDRRDIGHWLGAAISLAQARGMHRSTKNSNMRLKDRRLWKRIWWAIYTRDRSDAAALGRPMRIHDDDCDIEMLEESDFEDEEQTDSTVSTIPSKRIHRLYCIEVAKLSSLLGHVIKPKFTMSNTAISNKRVIEMTEMFDAWEANLPQELKYEDSHSSESRFWSGMLHILYNECLILLHRSTFLNTQSELDASSTALTAARRITRVTEDLLMLGMIRYSQVLLVPSLFAALTIHVTFLRRTNGLQATLAENQLRLCMLGLAELKDAWPVVGWIIRIFDRTTKTLPADHPSDKTLVSSESERQQHQQLMNDRQEDHQDQQQGIQEFPRENLSGQHESTNGSYLEHTEALQADSMDRSSGQYTPVFTFGPGVYNTSYFGYLDSAFALGEQVVGGVDHSGMQDVDYGTQVDHFSEALPLM